MSESIDKEILLNYLKMRLKRINLDYPYKQAIGHVINDIESGWFDLKGSDSTESPEPYKVLKGSERE
jgi:hypothetical protein